MDSGEVQLLIQLPVSNRALTLTLEEAGVTTLGDLKQSLFPSSSPYVSLFFFSHNGKILDDSSTLLNGIPTTSTTTLITLKHKLLGGGGDGGATGAESRDCYLNMYAEKKPDKVDPNERRLSKWTTCALSFEPLTPPCVVDRLGNIFNKETLVKSLLSKTLPKPFRHIKGLKDIISIHLSPVPAFQFHATTTSFQCPITGLELNGKYKFFALTKCGHVLSAKALKEVKSSACLVCHQEVEESDKIVINGTDEEVAALRERMEEEKATKLKDKEEMKKKKKLNKSRVGEVVVNREDGGVTLDSLCPLLSGKKKERGFDVVGVEKPSAKLEMDAKVANGSPAAPPKRFKAVDIAPPNANKQVYASIFTSSRKSDFKETYSCRSLPLGRN